MNVAVLIATVLIGSVIPVELVFEFRRARSFDAEPNRPKQRMHNSFMKTKELSRERNPFLLTGKRRWRLFRWIWPRTAGAMAQTVTFMEVPDTSEANVSVNAHCWNYRGQHR